MLANKLLAAMAGGEEKLYVDDVFQVNLRLANGSNYSTPNGPDLLTHGGMAWIKSRNNINTVDHLLFDTARGNNLKLSSNLTAASQNQGAGCWSPTTTGFTVNNGFQPNYNTDNYVDFIFRKAPKFFDVVTYTGNGGTKVVPHSIGSAPGMIVVKRTDTTADWVVYHQSVPANCGFLNTTNSFASAQRFSSVTSSDFTINVSTADVNASGGTYVAYLFAHDTGTDGLIQCGSFTVSSGTGTTEVNLGWEPQFLLTKYNLAGYNWNTYDSSRGWVDTTNAGNVNARLSANLSNAEATDKSFQPSATGFRMANSAVYPGTPVTILYLAIRRPNKPPTVGTQVYNAIARTGSSSAISVTGVGFSPDLILHSDRQKTAWAQAYTSYDRLRGVSKYLNTQSTVAEIDLTPFVTSIDMDGVTLTNSGFNSNITTYITNFFKRAPGVFDVVCYTGVGVSQTVAHGLGVPPELILVKHRTIGYDWYVYAAGLGNTKHLLLNSGAATQIDATAWNNTNPTSSLFSLGTSPNVNDGGASLVAYLFATKAGISKVGSYTGNGSSQTIDCGFTTGSRFILIKRTDATGDWYVWDTVRGIIAGNDPHLSLNTTTAEVTSDDSIDPDTSGFIVNQLAATNINVNAASYIFLAFA